MTLHPWLAVPFIQCGWSLNACGQTLSMGGKVRFLYAPVCSISDYPYKTNMGGVQ